MISARIVRHCSNIKLGDERNHSSAECQRMRIDGEERNALLVRGGALSKAW